MQTQGMFAKHIVMVTYHSNVQVSEKNLTSYKQITLVVQLACHRVPLSDNLFVTGDLPAMPPK